MLDIKELLFPNLITVLVQLCATGVIFALYMKYLHTHLLLILDKKDDANQAAYTEIETLNQQQELEKKQFEAEKSSQKEALDKCCLCDD